MYLEAVAELAHKLEPINDEAGLKVSKRVGSDYNFLELARSTGPIAQINSNKFLEDVQNLEVDPEDTEKQFCDAVNHYVEEEYGGVDPQELHDPEPGNTGTGLIE